LSVSLMQAVEHELDPETYLRLRGAARKKDLESLLAMSQHVARFAAMSEILEKAFFETVITACGATRNEDFSCGCGYIHLGALLTAMDLWETSPGDFGAAAVNASEVLAEVIRGWISGLSLDPKNLANECNCFLNRGADLLLLPRTGDHNLDPVKVVSAEVNEELLGEGMKHKSLFVARNATRLSACLPDSAIKGRVL